MYRASVCLTELLSNLIGSCALNERGHHRDSDNERTRTLDNEIEPQDGIDDNFLSARIERGKNHDDCAFYVTGNLR